VIRAGRPFAVSSRFIGAAVVVVAFAGGVGCASDAGQRRTPSGSAPGPSAGASAGSPAAAPATSSGGSDGIGRPAPEIVIDRMDGKPLSLSSLRGKVVLLDVWASWCGPCQKELPMLDAIARRLHGRGVEVLAVSIDQERSNLVKFLEVQPGWALTVAHDPRGRIAETLQPDKMPTSYVIDRAGVIRYVNSGFDPSDAAVIERLLEELAGAGP
jgi:thiol-disulfide isomerase/thioredoxin